MNKEDYKVYSDKMRKSIDAVNARLCLCARRPRQRLLCSTASASTTTALPRPSSRSRPSLLPIRASLVITPWDGTALKPIERAIQESDLGINPQNDGKSIRLNFPQLTEERRKELVKQIHKYSETGKVAIRNIRRDAMEAFKKKQKASEITEDDLKVAEKDLQKLTDDMCKEVDALLEKKEKELYGGLIWGSFPKRTRQGRLI